MPADTRYVIFLGERKLSELQMPSQVPAGHVDMAIGA